MRTPWNPAGHQENHERSWKAFFETKLQGQSRLAYLVDHCVYHAPAFGCIRSILSPGARILDIGCGVGASAIYLAACGYDVLGVDRDPEVIKMAQENLSALGSSARVVHMEASEVHSLGQQFELVLTLGVMEHFEADNFIRLLRDQARVAKYVLTVVPTVFTRFSGPVIDEHFYTARQLRVLHRDAGFQVLRSFSYGDLAGAGSWYRWVKFILPHSAYRVLQDRAGFAMQRACLATGPYS